MSTKPDPPEAFVAGCRELPVDPVIEAYKKDVDRTLLRENLKLTPEQRLMNLQNFLNAIDELRGNAQTVEEHQRGAVVLAYVLLFKCPGKEADGNLCRRPMALVVNAPQPLEERDFLRPEMLQQEITCHGCGWSGPRSQAELAFKTVVDWPY